VLLGRDRERRGIERVLARARSGASAVLALHGEPGIGKTALLDYAIAAADNMALLRARGAESEAQIPFAALLEVLRPALKALERIPDRQRVALEAALALRPGVAQDRFAIGAATLSLLAAAAEERPLLVVVDDAHWLDDPSAQALRFAFRRMLADPIAVVIAAREGEPSLLDGSGLPALRVGGLDLEATAQLLGGPAGGLAERLHGATAGNPLALLELAARADDLALAFDAAPLPVGTTISRAFVARLDPLDEATRRALVLAAASDTGDLAMLERAARPAGVDLARLAVAEDAGLLSLRAGSVEFSHPLMRSAIYGDAPPAQRRDAHRALAAALPDRDVDRRAWHLAAAAVGGDDRAAAALEQAGARARERSAYGAAAAAYERAGRLSTDPGRRARLLWQAAEAAWPAGLPDRAVVLLDEARTAMADPAILVAIEHLAGRIATLRGPVMRGHEILTAAAPQADPDRAVDMLAEAVSACFYAGRPAAMLAAAEQARALLSADAPARSRFLAAMAIGTARVVGGDGAAGAEAIREAVAIATAAPELRQDLGLLPWLANGPLFLRQADVGRFLVQEALATARARSAVGALPHLLNLIARDQATTDRWAVAVATYREAIELARESGQRAQLAFGLAGLAWLEARRGREAACRDLAAEALTLVVDVGTDLHGVWATAALGELELGLGDAGRAVEHFERQEARLGELQITDPDLSPAAEQTDAYLRLGRDDAARRAAGALMVAAQAKQQPWALARAHRCAGLVAAGEDAAVHFERALELHARTPDAFEAARTRLAYGERLRRERSRTLARAQLRAALETFERLDARPWAERARGELAATGETLRRRTESSLDALTPQELQIGLLLAAGRTTREAAAALFLSPKTVEYHLRHIYRKLGIRSREALAARLATAEDPAT
jgi:DNA-binding CsgD family transcriptional regulator